MVRIPAAEEDIKATIISVGDLVPSRAVSWQVIANATARSIARDSAEPAWPSRWKERAGEPFKLGHPSGL